MHMLIHLSIAMAQMRNAQCNTYDIVYICVCNGCQHIVHHAKQNLAIKHTFYLSANLD